MNNETVMYASETHHCALAAIFTLVSFTGPVPGNLSPLLYSCLHGRDLQIPEDLCRTVERAERHYVLPVYRVLYKILQEENLIDLAKTFNYRKYSYSFTRLQHA